MADDAGAPIAGGEAPSSLDRVVFFSDAVFAIAITLLVLPLADQRLPDEDLAAHLLALWPQLASFLLSFVVIGLFWLGHHRAYQIIVRVDTRLLLLNLLVLLFIALLPFPTAVLGEHGNQPPAAVLYATTMSLLGLTSAAHWRHASHGYRLIRPDVDPRDQIRDAADAVRPDDLHPQHRGGAGEPLHGPCDVGADVPDQRGHRLVGRPQAPPVLRRRTVPVSDQRSRRAR